MGSRRGASRSAEAILHEGGWWLDGALLGTAMTNPLLDAAEDDGEGGRDLLYGISTVIPNFCSKLASLR